MMPRRLPLILALAALPAFGQEANLSSDPRGATGAAAQLVLAQRAYDIALTRGEVLPLLAAIRLARGVTLRPATGWEKVTTGDAPDDAPTGATTAPDPAGEAALTIARNLAGEDTDLQDLVYDLDAQVPRGRLETAVIATSDLAPGQTDDWRLPLFGEVPAELAVIGDGDGPLALTLTDDSSTTLCTWPPDPGPLFCALTPARNGFFTLRVHNPGTTVNSYRLVSN